MAKGPEGKYIDKIHRQLSPNLYKLKMNMGMGAPGGIPDYYYEGDKACLWIEYKAIPSWDKKKTIPIHVISPLQKDWLLRAHNNKQKVAVIMGDSTGKSIILSAYTLSTNKPNTDTFDFYTPKEVAQHIETIVSTQKFYGEYNE